MMVLSNIFVYMRARVLAELFLQRFLVHSFIIGESFGGLVGTVSLGSLHQSGLNVGMTRVILRVIHCLWDEPDDGLLAVYALGEVCHCGLPGVVALDRDEPLLVGTI